MKLDALLLLLLCATGLVFDHHTVATGGILEMIPYLGSSAILMMEGAGDVIVLSKQAFNTSNIVNLLSSN